ncbi:MAG TPA: HlyD family efflux transporter periplasmic adaptor subunit [Candidatus Saccharimonadales bacterium]|nr:HlyD family efflux transporter periplasmic adaptor subunit [Candidatus Saccharimonadales bacterium]
MIVTLAFVTVGLSRLKPAAPLVEKSALFMDTVKRGEMVREVRGNGTLVPEDIRWIATVNAGRVGRILVLPGARVQAGTVLVELSNPDVEQAAFDAEWALKAAEASEANLTVQLASLKLTQESTVAESEANYSTAKLDFDVNDSLGKNGLVPALVVKESKTKADELDKLFTLEKRRLEIGDDAAKAQLAAQEASVAQLRAQLTLKRHLVDALKVRAGMDGILQRYGDLSQTTPLQEGQQLSAGAIVARVANQAKLKAVLKIPETLVGDMAFNQPAQIDTRNGIVPGHVVRIDPASENGTVTVDVALDAPLPKGARPDLSIDGTVELERLENVLYVGRPVQGQADSKAGLFKVVDAGAAALRVPVKLGRSSVTTIEIVEGLQIGDQVILSDMSQWDTYDRLRLN